ncbi:uncharacterized protein LOC122200937 [Panthera leo]|uniref:uncharacterized protein LOC122200937 n=1 Tax=Panthera leo TaxID=9689 RepID=UPI001C696ED9|nr:uncharacterized protein LOC122200937 [Panthera leo]
MGHHREGKPDVNPKRRCHQADPKGRRESVHEVQAQGPGTEKPQQTKAAGLERGRQGEARREGAATYFAGLRARPKCGLFSQNYCEFQDCNSRGLNRAQAVYIHEDSSEDSRPSKPGVDHETAQLATPGWGKADHLIHTSQSEFSPEKVAQVGILDDVNWGGFGWPFSPMKGLQRRKKGAGPQREATGVRDGLCVPAPCPLWTSGCIAGAS